MTARFHRSTSADVKIKEQFEFFDVSMNGTIEEHELMRVLSALDPEKWTKAKVSALMAGMDANNDGRVQYHEFVDWIFRNVTGEKVLLTEDEVCRAKDGLAERGEFVRKASEELLDQAKAAHWYKGPMKEKALRLLEEKADPNKADRSGVTVLMHMASKIDPPFAKQIIEHRADVSRHAKDFASPVTIAASNQDTELLRLFLMPDTMPVDCTEGQEEGGEDRSDSQQAEREARQVLSRELVRDMSIITTSRMRQVIEQKADLNFKDSNGWTPLTMASFFGRKECVDILLSLGATHASGSGCARAFGALLLRVDIRNKQGRTALHISARKNFRDVVEMLIRNGAAPDTRDHDGWTPLHHACFNGNSESVRVLVAQGATVDIKAYGGFTPFQVTRLHARPGMLSEEALALVSIPEEVDFGKRILPIIKDEEKSPHQKIEELLALPTVNQNMNRLRLGEHFFDPVRGPNQVRMQKVWELLIKPLLVALRTQDVDMPAVPPPHLSDEARKEHLTELQRRRQQQKDFFTTWMQATQGPMPTIHWNHDNRGAIKSELYRFLDLELDRFKAELDAVYAKLQESEAGAELIALPEKEVLEESLLSQLGAHTKVDWVERLDVAEAFEQLRLVGVVQGKQDDLAALDFAEMLTYQSEFRSGRPFWKNIYRKWLSTYAGIADYHFHRRIQTLCENFSAEPSHCRRGISATYSKGPLKTYRRFKEDERSRKLRPSADSFDGRTTAASCLDPVRGTISVGSPEAALAVLQAFRDLDITADRLQLVQVQNLFNEAVDGLHGFRYVEMNVHFKCGPMPGVCGREGKSLHVALVGEVNIVLEEHLAIKQRRSLQYKLWRGFFDWRQEEEEAKDDAAAEDSDDEDGSRLRLRGHAGLYEDDQESLPG